MNKEKIRNSWLPLVDEKRAGKLCGLTARGMQAKRLNGTGPIFIKIGRSVRYRPEVIQTWLESHVVHSTSEHTEAQKTAQSNRDHRKRKETLEMQEVGEGFSNGDGNGIVPRRRRRRSVVPQNDERRPGGEDGAH